MDYSGPVPRNSCLIARLGSQGLSSDAVINRSNVKVHAFELAMRSFWGSDIL